MTNIKLHNLEFEIKRMNFNRNDIIVLTSSVDVNDHILEGTLELANNIINNVDAEDKIAGVIVLNKNIDLTTISDLQLKELGLKRIEA